MANDAILIIVPIPDALLDNPATLRTVHRLYEQGDLQAFLTAAGENISTLMTRDDIGVSNELLRQRPHAGLIAIFGVGTDAIDLNYARENTIAVTITSGVLTHDVADRAIGLMLAGSRRLCQRDQFVRKGEWLNPPPVPGNQVSGKRIGILGMGNIGQAIARRAAAFDMQISYTSRHRRSELPYLWCDNLLALAESCDFLVIAAAGGESTKGLVNNAVLQALPGRVGLINIARGSRLDQQALIQALQKSDIPGAPLDGYEQEPNVPAKLLAMDNLVLQPHVGRKKHETRSKRVEAMFANVDNFFDNAPYLTDLNNTGCTHPG